MFKSLALYRSFRPLVAIRPNHLCPFARRCLSEDTKSSGESITEELLGKQSDRSGDQPKKELSFAEAFEKFKKLTEESFIPKKAEADPLDSAAFPTLLRNSTFIQLGDPVGKVVVGQIVSIVDDDLYVDFGGKFNAVCKRPKHNPDEYVRGAKVRVRINDLEISDRFLGSTNDMTLLEADVTIMGLIWSPVGGSQRDNANAANI